MPPSEDERRVETSARVFDVAGWKSSGGVRTVAAEVPVNIVYAPTPFAVMMATPDDLEDFAIGFSLTEGIIDAPSDIRALEIERVEKGLRLIVTLTAERMQRHLARSRNLAGRTGCGLCGIDDLDALPAAKLRTARAAPLEAAAIFRALADLDAQQPLNQATRAAHAAAWCAPDGAPLLVREDVGRHNALDKLIGAMARADREASEGFLLLTSRCSFEMIEKAAVFGIPIVVAMSAPTSLAIERARLHDMTLVAIARPDGATAFTGAERLRFSGDAK